MNECKETAGRLNSSLDNASSPEPLSTAELFARNDLYPPLSQARLRSTTPEEKRP